jgi:hypothetical protein
MMKWFIWSLVSLGILVSPAVNACQKGYKQTDVAGVCVEINQDEVNPTWRSDEKPPSDKMPSYQREGVTVVDAPSMAASDAQADLDRINAIRDGKRAAGIK